MSVGIPKESEWKHFKRVKQFVEMGRKKHRWFQKRSGFEEMKDY